MGKDEFKILNYDELPKKKGIGALQGEEVVDWIGIIPGFIFKTYHSKYGCNEFRFVKYKRSNQTIYFNVDNVEKHIAYSGFIRGNIGSILGIRGSDFKYEVGQVIVDEKRDMTLIDTYYGTNPKEERYSGTNYKWYKYKCNKCKGDFEHWIVEGGLKNGTGCSACSGKTVTSYNCMLATDPWMISLGIPEDIAKKYTSGSSKKISFPCPNCGEMIKNKKIANIKNNKSIGCRSCGDGISYPEKFVRSVLKQLELDYEVEYNPEWACGKKYDFYIKSLNAIIETHGLQHYKHTGFNRVLQEEQENDSYKKELALFNRIEYYIELDCRESDLEYIKNSILNSELNELFDLSKIDWLKCEEFALKNIAKDVCEYWNNKKEWETTFHLAEEFKVSRKTITIWLKNGNKLGWCGYDTKEEISKINKNNVKKVKVYKNGAEVIDKELSIRELSRLSEVILGTKLHSGQYLKCAMVKKIVIRDMGLNLLIKIKLQLKIRSEYRHNYITILTFIFVTNLYINREV